MVTVFADLNDHPRCDSGEGEAPHQDEQKTEKAIGLLFGQIGEDLLADDFAEQKENDPEGNPPDPRDLSHDFQNIKLHELTLLQI